MLHLDEVSLADDQEPICARSLEAVAELVGSIDLTMVKQKLMDADEGQGWSSHYATHVEQRYRRYLCMIALKPEVQHVPGRDIDLFWHQHILDTRAYAQDCDRVFGEFIHHFPYLGMRGDDDAKNLLSAFDKTKAYYAELFNEDYTTAFDDTVEDDDFVRSAKCGNGPNKCSHPWPGKCGTGPNTCYHPWLDSGCHE